MIHRIKIRCVRMILVPAALLTVGFYIAGCGAGAAADDSSKATFTIVATTGMIGDVARNIAGDRAHVSVLMGPGVDPHLYRPTRGDVRRLLAADVVFYNGLNLEGRMTETFEQIARSGKPAYAVTELIDESHLLESDEYPGTSDPHVWMDVRGWMKVTGVVADALAEFDPEGEPVYRERSEEYMRDLESLHEWARAAIATIPQERRILVTAHDAFSYFARAYDIEVEAIQGISTDSEAGLRRIEELINLLVSRQVAAVFTESSVPDKNVRALIEGARARGHAVRIGGELFSDAMGEEGTPEGTYAGMIEHNVRTIVEALGGSAAARPAAGAALAGSQ
jgi:manganese/zinc/iron transport system substrate-binding protein